MIVISHGRPKKMLDSSVDSAKRAIKSYNDTDNLFRIQNFIILMNIAYLRLFHLFFYKTIGEKYYYKDKSGKYKKNSNDGTKKSWDLSFCVKKFENDDIMKPGMKENIEMFVGIRNKIEHSSVSEIELEKILFGEIQSYVMNYNYLLVNLFGVNIAKFLRLPLILEIFGEAYNEVVNNSADNLFKFIEEYKKGLDDEIMNSEEFSFKMIALPNIVNKRTAPAITFMKSGDISDDLRKSIVAQKSSIIKKEYRNVGLYKTQKIFLMALEKFKKAQYSNEYGKGHASNVMKYICVYDRNTKRTDSKYCIYDEVNENFLYREEVLELLERLLDHKSRTEMNKELRENKYFEGRDYKNFDN